MQDLPLFPEQASTFAEKSDLLYWFLVAVSGFFIAVIFFLVVIFAVRYRRKSEEHWPTVYQENPHLEMLWTVGPLILALFIFVWGAKLYVDYARAPQDSMEVFVTGRQWMWKIQHSAGQREINYLHVPKGVPVKLTMTSEDVIHSFFIPAFRVKADVVPGRYTSLWFEATEAGTYRLYCAEYCGTEHSRMIGYVVVMEPADFQDWLQGGRSESMEAAGQRLFGKLACNTCHLPQSGERGPSLVGLHGKEVELRDGRRVRVDDGYLRESILAPADKVTAGYQPIMPAYQGQISEHELLQLIAYIKSQRSEG
ncbi:MAG: cytochrome c oxidase subunit II [Planctomycetota bacterium]|nr:MAG: cytochrome c oxidase subunit II [Planctomycetota bacterium]